ncbi:MAG: hypothetical protein QXL96_02335 [Ignisphaera sp.]
MVFVTLESLDGEVDGTPSLLTGSRSIDQVVTLVTLIHTSKGSTDIASGR